MPSKDEPMVKYGVSEEELSMEKTSGRNDKAKVPKKVTPKHTTPTHTPIPKFSNIMATTPPEFSSPSMSPGIQKKNK